MVLEEKPKLCECHQCHYVAIQKKAEKSEKHLKFFARLSTDLKSMKRTQCAQQFIPNVFELVLNELAMGL